MHDFIAPNKNRGCVCFWDTKSPGTKHNFGLAKARDTQLKVYDYVSHRFLTAKEIE